MKQFVSLLINLFFAHQILLAQPNDDYQRAIYALHNIEKLYQVNDGTFLFRETYPFDAAHQATYLGTDVSPASNKYSYLWPFSGSLSAYVALYEYDNKIQTLEHIDQIVWQGLLNYEDKRFPFGYASYVKTAPQSDRFYDDNIWLGIDFVDLYLTSGQNKYLDEALRIWDFVRSGMDDKLGGGIYWCEQRKESKNTCSNAPAVVYLAKLYEATKNVKYLDEAKYLYNWTKKTLGDPEDHLYWDNINLDSQIDKRKYPYNTGQMIQAGALLYKITGEEFFLKDAQESANSGFYHFFNTKHFLNSSNRSAILKKSDNWFIAIMMRGYIELYKQDRNAIYIEAFKSNLGYAWKYMRDENGLFGKDWTVEKESVGKKWLLDQFAMVEMYARLAVIQ